MDANGTRYYLLLGQADWGDCLRQTDAGLDRLSGLWPAGAGQEVLATLGWDLARSELTLPARAARFRPAPADIPPVQSGRRGAGCDTYGNWYWIGDDERSIAVRSAGSNATTPFWPLPVPSTPVAEPGAFRPWPPAPPAPAPLLRGLAVTREDYLVVGTVEPAGLLVFDLHAGGPPHSITWPDPPAGGEPFAPYDLAPTPGGGLWLLDRARDNPKLARLWSFDRRLRVIVLGAPPAAAGGTPDFTPGPDLPATIRPAQVPYEAAVVLRTDSDASLLMAVESLADGSALVLDNLGDHGSDFCRVWHYGLDGQPIGDPTSTAGLEDRIESSMGFTLQGHDFAFVARPAGHAGDDLGDLLIVGQDGNQAYGFAVTSGTGGQLSLDPLGLFLPMRLFSSRALVACGDKAYYDSAGNWVPLTEQPIARYDPETAVLTPMRLDGELDDETVRPAFDGGQPGCVWHRLFLDGCIPPECGIEVWSRTADIESDLPAAGWQQEPDPYRRGDDSELPWLRADAYGADGTWELLFQQARGRFLQLKLCLSGNERATPRLRALRVYYPRFSYLEHYIPGVYRQDPAPASFLDRFLANPEGVYTALEDRIATAQALFDVRTIPADYLDWLAAWFGVVFDPAWEERRRRLFLAHAPELFHQRGTLAGLVRTIRLATDAVPDDAIFDESVLTDRATIRIVESFRTRQVPGVVFGDPTDLEVPMLGSAAEDWTPAQGAGPLHQRYRDYLAARYGTVDQLRGAWGIVGETFGDLGFTSFNDLRMPARLPGLPAAATDWQQFLLQGLGFTYAPLDCTSAAYYQDFLARRYGYIDALNAAYGQSSPPYTGFDDVPLPGYLPESGARLRDWIQFASLVMPVVLHAHRFTVLVPTTTGAQLAAGDTRLAGTLVERVRRVVQVAAPAHTVFEVKEYWALFIVGQVRLGMDTVVDRGSRLLPVVLDASYLAQGYLNFSHPWLARNRLLLGRDRLGDCQPDLDALEE